MTEPKGAELLAAAAKQLRASFNYRRETNPHAGEKGREFEDLVIEFLNHHLPKRFTATRGFIVADTGGMTGHTDVIVYDQENALVFRADSENQIVPNGNVAAVLEVKTTLDGAALEDAAEKVQAAKSLEKVEAIPEADRAFAVTRTRGTLFAFETAISPKTAWERLAAINAKTHSDLWLDEIVVLDRWHISYAIQPPHLGVQGIYGGKATADISVPALYVVPVLAERGEFTLSEFMVRLTNHLAFFHKRPTLPFSFFTAQGKELRTLGGYWFATDGALRAVPASQFGDAKPAEVVEISEKGGRRLGSVEWFPWADGHVICFLGFPNGVPEAILEWFLGPYGHVRLSTHSPMVRVSDVKSGNRAKEFERALKFFDERGSPWAAKRL